MSMCVWSRLLHDNDFIRRYTIFYEVTQASTINAHVPTFFLTVESLTQLWSGEIASELYFYHNRFWVVLGCLKIRNVLELFSTFTVILITRRTRHMFLSHCGDTFSLRSFRSSHRKIPKNCFKTFSSNLYIFPKRRRKTVDGDKFN